MPGRLFNQEHPAVLLSIYITLLLIISTSRTTEQPREQELFLLPYDSTQIMVEQYIKSYSYKEALVSIKKWIAVDSNVAEAEKYADLLLKAGNIYFGISQFDSAMHYCNTALSIARSRRYHHTAANALCVVADVHRLRSDHQQAIAYCDSALNVARLNKLKKPEARALSIAGMVYHTLSEYDQARAYADSSLNVAASIDDHTTTATALRLIGTIHDAVSDFDTAIYHYRTALVIDKTTENSYGIAYDLHQIGRSYYHLGFYDSSYFYYDSSLSIRKKIKDRWGEGRTLGAIGLVYYMWGQYDTARTHCEAALDINQEVGDILGEALNLSSIGTIYHEVGIYDRALAFYDSALNRVREIRSRYGEGLALNNIAIVYNALSMYEKALAYYDTALATCREIRDHYAECLTLNNIAVSYSDLSQHQKALTYYDTALAVSRRIHARHSEGTVLHNMSNIYRYLNQNELALAYCDSALTIERNVADPHGEAYTLDDIGAIYHALKQYELALAYFDSALSIKRTIKDRRGQAATLTNIGRSYHSLKEYEHAIAYYDSAMVILKAIRDRRRQSIALDYIGQAYEELGNVENAIHNYKSAIDLKETIRHELQHVELRVPYIEAEKDTYERLIILLIMLERYDEAFDYLERSRSDKLRNAFEQGQMAAYDTSLKRMLERISFLGSEMEQLERRYQNNEIAEIKYESRMSKLEGQFNQKMLDLKVYHPQLYNVLVPQHRMLKHIQEIIPGNTLFLEFVSFNDVYVVLLFSKNVFLAQSRPEPKDSIDKWITQAITSLKWQSPEEELIDQYARLYEVLIKPSEPEISKFANIVIIPYGILHYLPFHVLRRKDNSGHGQYFVEWKRISYLPSASYLTDLLQEKEHADKSLLAFGNADGTLPSAEIEVDLIGRLYAECQICKCEHARKDRFIEMCGDYRLIHLATHGVLDPDPRFSYIVFAPPREGNLTVREILGLSGHFRSTSLVTLSACETAVEANPDEAGMELITLSNAFKVAGVPTTVASLWEIADRSTALLMEDFYRNLRNHDFDKLEALRQAQIAMIGHEQYGHPYYWAPFILIGEWQ